MKRSMVLFLLLLASCVSSGPTASPEFIRQVQTYSESSCHFRPTDKTVVAIYAKNNRVLNDPQVMAAAICEAKRSTKP